MDKVKFKYAEEKHNNPKCDGADSVTLGDVAEQFVFDIVISS